MQADTRADSEEQLAERREDTYELLGPIDWTGEGWSGGVRELRVGGRHETHCLNGIHEEQTVDEYLDSAEVTGEADVVHVCS